LTGIEDAIAKNFPRSNVQLCVVHLERNVLKHVKSRDKEEIAADLKDVFQTSRSDDSVSQGWQRWTDFIHRYSKKYPALNNMLKDRYQLYFTYLSYDYRIRSMVYTTNWIERLNRDYKRTTKMRGALPNPEATILLLGYVAMNRSAYNRKIPKLDYEKNSNGKNNFLSSPDGQVYL
jgi:putative transposase